MNDREWRAQIDAETLAQAKMIQADQGRMRAAQARAAEIAKDKQAEARAMVGVAGGAARSTSAGLGKAEARPGNPGFAGFIAARYGGK